MRFYQQQSDSDRTDVFIKCIQEAARKIRFVNQAEQKCSKIRNVLQTDNEEQLWMVLQEYLNQYTEFIYSLKCFTGICVIPVDAEFYKRITVDEIKNRLRIVVGYVYVNEAIRSNVKSMFKECLKKCLREGGCFTKEELNNLSIIK